MSAIMQQPLTRMILSRELGQYRRSKKPYLDLDREVHPKLSGSTVTAGAGTPSLPYAVAFSKSIDDGRLMATACEDGFISIIDSGKKLPYYISGEDGAMPRALWQAHRNAVFDVVWAKDDQRLLTPSGDMNIGIWDTQTASLLSSCQGHNGSVKSVCPLPGHDDVFASGSRDGAIMLWDSRSPTVWSSWLQRQVLTPTWEIHDAHGPRQVNKTPPPGRGGRKGQAVPQSVSITSVVFIPHTHLLASSGSGDTMVKLWDMRKASAPVSTLQAGGDGKCLQEVGGGISPLAITPPAIRPAGMPPCSSPGAVSMMAASFSCRKPGPFGITCMAVSHQGRKLLVNCTDSRLYMFDTTSATSMGPSAVFSGHHTPPGSNSFYVKCGFSPDGNKVACGSMDEKAYVWEVGCPLRPPTPLLGHSSPGVCVVAWSYRDPARLATASDDMSIKVWDLQVGNLLPPLPATKQMDALNVGAGTSPLGTPATPFVGNTAAPRSAATADEEGKLPLNCTGLESFLRHERECAVTPLSLPHGFSLAPHPMTGPLTSPAPLKAEGPSVTPVPLQHDLGRSATPAPLSGPLITVQHSNGILDPCVPEGGGMGREASLALAPDPIHTSSRICLSPVGIPCPMGQNSPALVPPERQRQSPSLALLPGGLQPKPYRSAISPLMSMLRGSNRSQGALTPSATPTRRQGGSIAACDFSQSPALRLAFDIAGNAAAPQANPVPTSHTYLPAREDAPFVLSPSRVKHVAAGGSAPPPDSGPSQNEDFNDNDKENIDPALAGLVAMMMDLPPSASPRPPIQNIPADEEASTPTREEPVEGSAGPLDVGRSAAIALVTLVAPDVIAPGPDTAAVQGSASLKRTWQPALPGDLEPSGEGAEREAKRQDVGLAYTAVLELEETEETAAPSPPLPAVLTSHSWGRDSLVPCSYPDDEDSRPISGCANSPLLIDALSWRPSGLAWTRRGAGGSQGEASGSGGIAGETLGVPIQQALNQCIAIHSGLDAASRSAWEPGKARSNADNDGYTDCDDDDEDEDDDEYSDGEEEEEQGDGDEVPEDQWGITDDVGAGPGVQLMRGHPPAGRLATDKRTAIPHSQKLNPALPQPKRVVANRSKIPPVEKRDGPTASPCCNNKEARPKQRTLLEFWGAKDKSKGKTQP